MSSKNTLALNIKQNQDDFELEPLDIQPALFRYGYLSKTLDPPKEDPENLNNYRTVTVKCLFKGCG
jgi:hypothetical protein